MNSLLMCIFFLTEVVITPEVKCQENLTFVVNKALYTTLNAQSFLFIFFKNLFSDIYQLCLCDHLILVTALLSPLDVGDVLPYLSSYN